MPQSEADSSVEQGRQVAVRGSYVDSVGVLLQTSTEIDPQILLATLQHFYLRYLLGVGDSNLNQVLIRRDHSERLVAGIDMEEKRSREGTGSTMNLLFSKPPRKVVRQLLQPYLKDIQQLVPHQIQSPLDSEIIQQRIQSFAQSLAATD